MEIMVHNKIVKIGKVYQYDNIECDIISENDFLQQFSIYQQTIYTIIFNTPSNHRIRVPRILKLFRTNYDQNAKKWRTKKKHLLLSCPSLTQPDPTTGPDPGTWTTKSIYL